MAHRRILVAAILCGTGVGLRKFGYNPHQVGMVLAVAALVSAVVQAALTGPLTRRWGEAAVIKFTLFTNALGFLILLTPTTYASVLLATGAYTLLHAMLRPAITALTSKRASLGSGTAMGLNNAFISLGQIVGPLWAGFAFDVNMDLPYLSGAGIMLVGFVMALAWVS